MLAPWTSLARRGGDVTCMHALTGLATMQASLPSVAAIHLSMTACISVRSVAWRLGRGSNTKIPADIYFFFFSLVILVEYHPYDSLYAGHVT